MYILNTKTLEFNLRYTFPDDIKTFYDVEKRNHSLASYQNDTLFISCNNSIVTYNLNFPNRAVYNYVKLPNNGRFVFNFQKIGNKFYGLYKDDLRIHNNYWLEIIFRKVEDPQPIIQADDFDFGTFDIKDKETKKTKVNVENLSNVADLIIFTYGISDTVNFTTNIREKIISLPFTIPKGQRIVLDIEFTPKTIGFKDCRIQFVANTKIQDEYIDLKGIAIDTINTSIEDNFQIEYETYLYSLPPFPNPTQTEVIVKIYWDNSIDINNSEIAVYDINGNKVSVNGSITIEKLNDWSGFIKWNCRGVPAGIFLIRIQHGNNTKTLKVVVN